MSETELRNVKLFTQIKSFKPNFAPRKARNLRQIQRLDWIKLRHIATSGGEKVIVLSNKPFFKQNIIKACGIYPQTPSFSQICVVSQNVTPTFQYFYTDISAISVTYWIFVHISCHSLHHSNVYVLRGITAFSLLCFAHNPGKMAISLMPYLD